MVIEKDFEFALIKTIKHEFSVSHLKGYYIDMK